MGTGQEHKCLKRWKDCYFGTQKKYKNRSIADKGTGAYASMTPEVETGVLGIQGHQQVHGKLEGNLANRRHCF